MGAGGLASQTVFPPSTHVSGEPIEWAGRGASEIAEVDGDELIQRARRLAAASELARSYPRSAAATTRRSCSAPSSRVAAFRSQGRRRSSRRWPRHLCSRAISVTIWRAPRATARRRGSSPGSPCSRRRSAKGRRRRSPIGSTTRESAKDAARAPKPQRRRQRHGATPSERLPPDWPRATAPAFSARARADAGFPFEPNAIAALNQLAKRRAPDFERLRTQLKAETKVRFAALEAAMKAEAAIGDSGDDGKQGRPIEFPEPEPWPTPVDGAALLDDIAGALGRHVIMSAPSTRRRRAMGRSCLSARSADDLAAARHPVGGQRVGQNHAARRSRAARPAAALGRQCEPDRDLPRHRRACADAAD